MTLHKQKGVAAVELALIMVPMLIMCFGIVEVGRALNYYNGLVKSTRGAARYLTRQNLNGMTPTTRSPAQELAVTAAQSLAVCGKTSCSSGDPKLVPGLDRLSQVEVTPYPPVSTGQGSVSLVSVTISGVDFTSFLPFSISTFRYSPVKITMAWSVT